METLIDKFIKRFRSRNTELVTIFTEGYCYQFACILKNIFGGTILYNDIDNHFVCLYNGKLYDITGEIVYPNNTGYIDWEEYQKIEPLNSNRVIDQCIFINCNDK